MRYYWFSILSGCTWALIALLLSLGTFGWLIVGGMIAAPFIGLFIGFLYRPAYRLPKVAQVFAALFTLYMAAALFGLAIGTFDALWRNIPNRTGTSEVILQGMLATLWGITFTGYILLLWPLAFLNHRLLDKVNRAA